MSTIVPTGIFATEEQAAAIKSRYIAPMAKVHGVWLNAWEELCHECALKQGLPDIKGHYGIDFRDRQFVRFDDQDGSVPDHWKKT